MPWKSTLSKSTLIGPGFANAHAYRPSLSQCHGCRLPWPSVLGLVPGFANAHGNPQIFAVPWMPWKSTLSQSTRIGPGFASAHGLHPVPSGCHGLPTHGNPHYPQGFASPWKYPQSMEIHTIPDPYRAGSRVCQHAYPQIFSAPLSQSGFANAHAYPPSRTQCHVDAMEIHTIQGLPMPTHTHPV